MDAESGNIGWVSRISERKSTVFCPPNVTFYDQSRRTFKGHAVLKTSSGLQFYLTSKKHLKNVGPIRHCEPPHALILHCHSPGVATVARRHCRMPPAHRCRQRQRQRQRVTEGTAMAPRMGPINGKIGPIEQRDNNKTIDSLQKMVRSLPFITHYGPKLRLKNVQLRCCYS